MPCEKEIQNIEDAYRRCCTRYFWILNYLVDYSDFDFLYEPKPWEAHQRHAFGSVWQKDSGTYLVPRAGYTDTNYHQTRLRTHADMSLWTNTDSVEDFDYSWHPDYSSPPYYYQFGTQHQKTGGPLYSVSGADEYKYVTQSTSRARAVADLVCEIDHDNTKRETVYTVDKRFRFFDTYMGTLKRIANHYSEAEYIWITSSCCDYDNFDFTWHPEKWQNHMLHVFASNEQKFGDTFFMHVPSFRERIEQFELLEWYDLNFVDDISVPRRAPECIHHSSDSHVTEVGKHTWSGHYALFTTDHNTEIATVPTVPLWRPRTRTVVPLSTSGSACLVPKDAVAGVNEQLYDYPFVDQKQRTVADTPLDIVFISNGETNADANYSALQRSTSAYSNRVVRVDGVNGRVAAYHAAAQASSTPWFFAVFAKLEVKQDFDWNWQPDFLQSAKHYIFHAENPVNGLIYGHMAMIAYNRGLTLANTGSGLDFTLDDLHEVVPIVSGTAYYAVDPWMAWRTAFRETLKLMADQTTVENQYRLERWLDDASEGIEHWSYLGAQDAHDFYQSCEGDFDVLKQSYDWQWLSQFVQKKHNLSLDQLYTPLQDQ